ncbi:MAG TPA: flavin reductase, partial [Corynebacterium nuruki]|nr:flavin reductase [Corynebacterium nuruki]
MTSAIRRTTEPTTLSEPLSETRSDRQPVDLPAVPTALSATELRAAWASI